MKIAIFGGSFDPIHFGHLWAAQHAAEQLGLDEVVFLPTATSPLKPDGPLASDAMRLRMTQLALQLTDTVPLNEPGGRVCRLTIDDREIRRGGVSYTIDTAAQMQRQRPAAQWFLMIGSDAFAAIDRWHRASELLEQILPLVYRRGDDAAVAWNVLDGLVSPERAAAIQANELRLPRIEVSSSEIRQRVAAGRNIRFQVAAAVADFIRDQRLYQAAESPS